MKHVDKLKMARIYFNCPFIGSNGNGLSGNWRLTGIVCLVFLGFLLIISVPYLFSSPRTPSSISFVDELNYGIVIDCGSSGSRIYVYQWPPHSGNPSDLLNIQQVKDEQGKDVVWKISPGLSSFEDNPDDASEHIKKLLDYAKGYIPLEKHRETSLYVMATAGMRMLPESKQKAILADLQTDIKSEFDFVAPENHFEVISGKQEGVYAWIAINYVLDKFSHSSMSSESDLATVTVMQPGKDGGEVSHRRKRTVGIIDMGGGSVQIAFEVTDKDQIKEIPNNLVTELNLGCQDSDTEHSYRVYVTTFLGFGANSARTRYEEMLMKRATLEGKTGVEQDPITDVCLPKDMPSDLTLGSGAKYHLKGSGEYDKCQEILTPLMNTTELCTKQPCSINGVHQPKIDPATKFYGFSEFWYCMEDVFRMGGHYDYEVFKNTALKFCATNWSTLKGWYDKKLYPKADDHRFTYQCFKSAWMTDMFHKAFGFPTTYSKLTSAQLVRGQDVGWTLGALIYRTRFLPLRDIEKQHLGDVQAQSVSFWTKLSRLVDSPYLLIFCFLVVVAAIAIYMKFLRCCPGKDPMPRVPSMSYLMTDSDQMEQGVRYTKTQGFISL